MDRQLYISVLLKQGLMRRLAILIVAVLCMQVVAAVSIGFPTTLSDDERVRVGNTYSHEFVLKGDVDEQDVLFFIRPAKTGLFEINGRSEYQKNYNLDPFENKIIEIEFEGMHNGETEVTWGFTYVDSGDGDGVGFEQTIQDKFVVEVYGEQDDDDDDSGSSGSGGRSGGGGGSFYEYDSSGDVAIEVDSPEPEEEPVVMQDISTQGSATNEIVADPEPRRITNPISALSQVSSKDAEVPKEGGALVLMVMIFSIMMMISSFFAARIVKEGEE